MNPNERIREQRIRLGLRDKDVADRVGMTIHEYSDVEQHEDELRTVVELKKAKQICDILGLNLLDLFEIYPDQQRPIPTVVPKHKLIKDRREALNLTISALAEAFGFEESTMRALEDDPDAINRWPADLVMQLAERLEIAPYVLMR